MNKLHSGAVEVEAPLIDGVVTYGQSMKRLDDQAIVVCFFAEKVLLANDLFNFLYPNLRQLITELKTEHFLELLPRKNTVTPHIHLSLGTNAVILDLSMRTLSFIHIQYLSLLDINSKAICISEVFTQVELPFHLVLILLELEVPLIFLNQCINVSMA